MDIVKLAISKPVGVTVAVILVLMFGLIGVGAIPIQLTPTVDYPIITVETYWPGRSPQEMVDEITKEQEERLKNVTSLKKMASTSSEGSSNVTLEFTIDADISRALQEVSDALRQVPDYPDDVTEPVIRASEGEIDNAIAWRQLLDEGKAIIVIPDTLKAGVAVLVLLVAFKRLVPRLPPLVPVFFIALAFGALGLALPDVPPASGVQELPGQGLLLKTPEGEIRLGSRNWCGPDGAVEDDAESGPELWLTRSGQAPRRFAFSDALRPDAAETVAMLKEMGYRIVLLSGDRPSVVSRVAAKLGIDEARAECRPDDKVAVVETLADEGRRIAMVGDGLNDAPALAAALVSISPSNAADISQTAADAVFQGDRLDPVIELLNMASRAERLVKQNFALSFAYNLLTVPLAMAGLVTPLIAAVSMSASSLAVVGNALRLNLAGRAQR